MEQDAGGMEQDTGGGEQEHKLTAKALAAKTESLQKDRKAKVKSMIGSMKLRNQNTVLKPITLMNQSSYHK
ncbi:uncharacterized [Tachysurus ichikawai]